MATPLAQRVSDDAKIAIEPSSPSKIPSAGAQLGLEMLLRFQTSMDLQCTTQKSSRDLNDIPLKVNGHVVHFALIFL
jgi:hypothetical protein